MIKKLIISIVFLYIFFNCKAQSYITVDDYLQKTDSIVFFTVDNFNSMYFIDVNNVYTKINSEDKSFYTFKNKSIANYSSIDVSNPFKLLIYNPLENKIWFLDKTMSLISEIDFQEIDQFSDDITICNSAENKVWVYDKQENSLFKYHYISKKTIETENFKWLNDESFNPIFFHEISNKIVMQLDDFKVVLFDIFGKKQTIYTHIDGKIIGIIDDKIYFISNNNEIKMNDLTKKQIVETKIKIPLNAKCSMNPQYIYILNEKKIKKIEIGFSN